MQDGIADLLRWTSKVLNMRYSSDLTLTYFGILGTAAMLLNGLILITYLATLISTCAADMSLIWNLVCKAQVPYAKH